MPTNHLFLLLQQEGYITRSSICTALTELRNANLGSDKGRYYTGFFQFSIGLERLAKLALILDYMVSHGLKPPGERGVRSFGHNLKKLYSAVEVVTEKHRLDYIEEMPISQHKEMLLDWVYPELCVKSKSI